MPNILPDFQRLLAERKLGRPEKFHFTPSGLVSYFSTQNQAFNALLFLFREVIKIDSSNKKEDAMKFLKLRNDKV
jgi:hypothetical protein